MRDLRMAAAFVVVAALAFAAPIREASAAPRELPTVEDDFPRALEEAKVRGRLLFVDAWASWCHSCVFFREHVLPNADAKRIASAVVVASIDTEREENRRFLERYPVRAWPTFFLIDPRTGDPRFVGTRMMAPRELEAFLEREAQRFRDEVAGRRSAAGDGIVRAASLRAKGDHGKAARAYEAILEVAKGSTDAERGDALEALVAMHRAKKDDDACAAALAHHAHRVDAAARAPALALGLSCVRGSDDRLRPLVALGLGSIDAPGLLPDDRSTLFEAVHEALETRGEADAARVLATRWLAFLERSAEEAATAGARATFDAHRVLAAVAGGDPARALEAVERSARDFPDDPNPWARRATLLRALGRDEEALAALDSALARVQGPRRSRVLESKAEVLVGKGRFADAAATLHEALVVADGFVDADRRAAAIDRLASKLAEARFRAFVEHPDELPPIVQAGDPVLRVRSRDVPRGHLGTDPFARLVSVMAAVMRKAPGVGLAAPQIGIPWRLFVLEDTDERMANLSASERIERERSAHPFTVVVNPQLRMIGDDLATFPEGCLSVSGFTALVPRARVLHVDALDAFGVERSLDLRGWPARIVQHEADHIDGTLYVDRMDTRSFATGENARRFPLRARKGPAR